MSGRIRLTPAQRQAIALLAADGAEARPTRGIRWEVTDRLGRHVGTVHSETLACLRDRGLTTLSRNPGPTIERPLVERITDAGRALVQGGAP